MHPPRVILVMSDQWPRALLRASLRETGYDAVGARSIAEAWLQPRHEAVRGDVALIVLDQDALQETRPGALRELIRFHGEPPVVLIAHAMRPTSDGPWTHIWRRPLSVGDLVSAVQEVLPLEPAAMKPLD